MNVVPIIPAGRGNAAPAMPGTRLPKCVWRPPVVARNERLSGYAGNAGASKVQKLSDISLEALPRFSTGFKEFDVLGGGVVPGSAILIGGNPGAGKSTLLLQTLCKLAEQMKTLYVTGEESLQQVAMRAHRLGLPTANLNMLSETSIEQICLIADEEQPKLMVIDSIQVMGGHPVAG
jgi:DNA repair protein RadA/Sms